VSLLIAVGAGVITVRIITARVGRTIAVGANVKVILLQARGHRVRLGFLVPKELRVQRKKGDRSSDSSGERAAAETAGMR
jgi:sRNA-binding carbon storage regulator CsrA